MKRAIPFLFLIVFAQLSRAQWRNADFPSDFGILAFGVHDTSLFWGYPGNAIDASIFRRASDGTWFRADTGLGQSQITFFASLGKYLFASPSNSRAFFSSDNGATWNKANIAGPVWTNGTYLFGQYITPTLNRSRDGGITWDSVSNLRVQHAIAKGPWCVVSTSSGIYRSADSGGRGTWKAVSAPLNNITCFALNDSVLYAANGSPGKSGGQLIKSTDSGATWQLMTTSFDVSSLASDSVHLFAGGTQGVYMLNADGQSWTYESDQDVLKGHGVVALGVFDTLLFTDFAMSNPAYQLYSRSIPEMTAHSAVQTKPAILDTLMIYPNPLTSTVTITGGGNTTIEQVSVLNVLGVDLLDVSNNHQPELSLDLSKLPSGTYFLRVQTEDRTVLRKIVKE